MTNGEITPSTTPKSTRKLHTILIRDSWAEALQPLIAMAGYMMPFLVFPLNL
jgi:hypothetical protein